MKMLYVVNSSPFSTLGHASSRARNFILEWEKQGHQVRVLFPQEKQGRTFFEKIKGFFHSYHFNGAGKQFLKMGLEVVQTEDFDVLVAEELFSAWVSLQLAKSSSLPVVYVAHNVESQLYSQIAPKGSLWEMIRKFFLKNAEVQVLRECHLIFSFSPEDRCHLQKLSGRPDIQLTRAGIEIPALLKASPRKNLIFIGALDYFPNVEALLWYAKQIHPLLKSPPPLVVAGRNPVPQVKEICQQMGFELRDSPPSLVSTLEQGMIEIVPLLSGSGTRGKILEAAAYQVPVISTSKGAEGLGFTDQKNIILADSAEDFSEALNQLIRDSQLRDRLAQSAHDYVQGFAYPQVVQDLTLALTKL